MDVLFELPEEQPQKPAERTCPQDARVYRPVRNQVEMVLRDLDSTLPEDHVARSIWTFLGKLDLSAFYASIKAVLSRPGHPASDPQVLLALWLLATVDGIGKARQLGRLCHEHDAYRWMRGGVPVNYHMLSNFRVAHQKEMDEMMSQILAAMMSVGLVTLRHAAQDGMRVRASAGSGSFRREARLEQFLEEARAEVARLAKEREAADSGVSRKQQAARERAVRERQERIEEALRNLPELKAAQEKRKKKASKAERAKMKEPRVSTTDPEARVMKMADGGFRPAYNMQIATDVDSQVILGVNVTNSGEDAGQAVPMVEQIKERVKVYPDVYLADGGFVKLEDITSLDRKGIEVYAPPPTRKSRGSNEAQAAAPQASDTPEVVKWRERMQTQEAKGVYKERAATAECVNALARARGMTQLTIRGTQKVLSALLLLAITHNLMRWISLTT